MNSNTNRHFWRRVLTLVPLLIAGLTAGIAAPVGAQTPVSNVLSGITPPQVLNGKATLIGPYPTDQTLHLVIALQPPHLAAEEQFLQALQTRGNPLYHHFLTPEQWNAQYAPTPQAEQAVVDWATAQGMPVTHRYSNRLLVDVRATVGAIERAFSININTYQLGTRAFYSNDRTPALPSSLNGIVQNVVGLNNLNAAHAYSIERPPSNGSWSRPPAVTQTVTNGAANGNPARRPKGGGTRASGGPGPNFTNGYIDPNDLNSSYGYNVGALYNQGHCCYPNIPSGATTTPSNTSIAIAGACGFLNSDLDTFRNQYGMAYHWQQVNVDGGPSGNNNCANASGGGGFETTLDIEYATAMSNSYGCYCATAMIYMYLAPASSLDKNNNPLFSFSDTFAAMNQVVSDNLVRSFSMSWGCAESCYGSSNEDTGHGIFDNMLGLGISPTIAAGDNGAYEDTSNSTTLASQYPGADPDVVSAGGSELHLYNDGTYNYETTWNSGGGGCSTHFAQPSYQSGSTLCPNSSNTGYMRAQPDVSLNASCNTAQAIYFNGSWGSVCGTSEVAPELAGLFAQFNAYGLYEGSICGSGGTGACSPLGNLNNHIYAEGAETGGGRGPHYAFYDITTGNNDNGTGTGDYAAGTGYDLATGWGSFNALQLAWDLQWESIFDYHSPQLSFSGPTTGQWYNSEQTISWTLSDPAQGDVAAAGPDGFTQGWDSIPTDSFSETTPGTGDSYYYGPQFPNATSGYLNLSWAGQGCHTAHVMGWDNVGYSTGDQTYGSVCYDTIAPYTTSISFTPTSPSNASSVTINAASTDPGCGTTGSCANHIEYWANTATDGTDSGSWLDLGSSSGSSGSLSWNTSGYADGTHLIAADPWDNAGNASFCSPPASQCASYQLDTTAPQTSILINGAAPVSSYSVPVSITLNASDPSPGTGILKTYYQLDGGSTQTYGGAISVNTNHPAPHTIKYWSVDNVGNTESAHTTTFTVTIPITLTKPAASSVTTSTATLTGTYNLNGLAGACNYIELGTGANSTWESGSTSVFGYQALGFNTVTASGTNNYAQSATGLLSGSVYYAELEAADHACPYDEINTDDSGESSFMTATPIKPGWNLLAIATNKDTTDAASALGFINASSVLNGQGKALAVLANGQWRLFVPGYSPTFPLSFGEGIVVQSGATGTHNWLQTANGSILTAGGSISLNRGWNAVAPVRQPMSVAQVCSATGATQVATYNSGYTSYTCASLPASTPVITDTQSVFLLEPSAHTWSQS